MLNISTIDFLKKLKKNNNRTWFSRNKNLYEDAKYDFEILVFELIQKLSQFDETISGLEPKQCIFRIYKDVRFSKDKTPYKTNFGASINTGGRKYPSAGYYINIEPDDYFLASGLYKPPPEILKMIRMYIVNNSKLFLNIISDKNFKKYFAQLWQDDKLKSMPKGFDVNSQLADYLKLKSFIVWHSFPQTKLLGKSFINYAANVLKAAKPLNDFLNSAAGVKY
jgi:uncharacterized protein (TIGR02453 family)